MQKPKQIFHSLSYLQYPLLVIGLYLIVKPVFKGYDFLSENPEYLFQNYNNALIFLGLTLSFASLQDASKTSLSYEKKIWRNPKKAKTIFFFTLFTLAVFCFAGIVGFLAKESVMKEFSYGSIILSVGLLGYLKLQMEIFEHHSQIKEEKSLIEDKPSTPTQLEKSSPSDTISSVE